MKPWIEYEHRLDSQWLDEHWVATFDMPVRISGYESSLCKIATILPWRNDPATLYLFTSSRSCLGDVAVTNGTLFICDEGLVK